MDRQTRDREQTEQRILNAAVEIIRENGFRGLGINAVAERAGVSKVLIYRYFQGMGGVLDAVAARLDMTKTGTGIEVDLGRVPPERFRAQARRALLDMHAKLAGDPMTQQLMTAELTEDNEVTRSLAAARERQGLAVSRGLAAALAEGAGYDASVDTDAIFAVAAAAIYYLTIRSRTVAVFNGVDLQGDEGWERLCGALALMLEKTLVSGGAPPLHGRAKPGSPGSPEPRGR